MFNVTFRRRLAGLALIGAFATLLISELVGPRGTDTNLELLDAVAADRAGYLASALLVLASTVLFIPAVLGILGLVRERARVIGHLGVGFGFLGALGHTAFVTYALFVAELADAGPRAQMAALLDDLDSGLAGIVMPFIMSFALSLLLMGIALYRARAVPRWVLLVVTAAVVIELAAPTGTLAAAVLKQGLVTVGFGYLGVRLLRADDRRRAAPVAEPRMTSA